MDRLGNDQQLVVEVIQLFLLDCPQRLASITAAVDARDGEQIRTAAHALKGAAGNLSATGLHEAAQALERIGAESRFDEAPAAGRQLAAAATRVMEFLRYMEGRLTTETAA